MADESILIPEDSTDDRDQQVELAEPFPTAQPVSYFGADFDVAGLVRRLNEGDIIIPSFDPQPDESTDLSGFQRSFVWRKYQMDRFVESLLLGYPVPAIFLVQQENKKLLVLDGQQRLRSLQTFYSGELASGAEFELEDVGDRFLGLTYSSLPEDLRRALDNSYIHTIVIRYEPGRQGEESVYQLFERLNSSGSNLYPHEIRVALYPGLLIDFIRELNALPTWRELSGLKSLRLRDHERILRYLAFYVNSSNYHRPLKGFLNEFTREHRDLEGLDAEMLRLRFTETCEILALGPGRNALRLGGSIGNAALSDAVLVGVSRRLDSGPIRRPEELSLIIEELKEDRDFRFAITRATADEPQVQRRLEIATEYISRTR